MDNKNYTKELNDLLSYVEDVLINEFPSKTITQEHLVTAILDKRKCHANIILDNCLMTENIDKLRNVFISYLNEHSTVYNYTNRPFSKEVENILSNAANEIKLTNSKLIGSEHILLSMLNPENDNNKMINIFKNVGIDYTFILNKCNEKVKKTLTNNINVLRNNIPINMLKFVELKSDINPRMLVSKNNYISTYTIDLNKMSREGKLDELIGRKTEIEQIIKLLARRRKNNVVLVGNSGCGKTAIIHGLVNLIENDKSIEFIRNMHVVQLNVSALISGTVLRGSFEERIKGLFDEMKGNENYILFIDDIHTVLKSNTKEKDSDISSLINEILADNKIKVIGTTTFKDYKGTIESNPMLSRRFQKLVIEPSSKEETLEILKQNKHYYEEYHNVKYTDEALIRCIDLADRYISTRSLPDSAIDVLDLSGAKTCLENNKPQRLIDIDNELKKLAEKKKIIAENGDFESVDEILTIENTLKAEYNSIYKDYKKNINQFRQTIDVEDICKTISDMTNIPISKTSTNEKKKLANIDNVLKQNIIGQDDAIDKICRAIKRNKIGLGNKNKPISTMLLVGKSGVGKTLIAKKLAEEVFGDENALVRIDMSEYSEKSSVSKLTGTSPGYIGYDNGGQLTEKIKNKQYCVILLDEIEKANEEVYNVFLQLFDEGRLTDGSGQIVNFKNTIILMTSNVGTKKAQEFGNNIGFIEDESKNAKAIIEKEIKKTFTPEFINRIDQIVYFNDLTEENLQGITVLEIKKLANRLNSIGYDIKYNNDVVNLIVKDCSKKKEFGARPILRYIQDTIEDNITDLILKNNYEKNYVFNISVSNGDIYID